MAEGKKAYYQVSFTGGQALAAVVVLIVALGVAFFLGARAGFEKSSESETPAAKPAPAANPTSAAPATASTETAATAPAEPGTSTEEAPVFEDREAGVSEAPKTSAAAPPASSAAPSRTEIAAGAPKTSGPSPSAGAPRSAARPPEAAEAPAKTASETPHKAGAGGGFYVQIVSTSSHGEANRWKEKLAAKKYRTAAVSSVDSPKGKLWRVRIGPYPDRAQANKAAAKITVEFRQKAWVAPE